MNLPETAKLQEIYGETEICGARLDVYKRQDRGIWYGAIYPAV